MQVQTQLLQSTTVFMNLKELATGSGDGVTLQGIFDHASQHTNDNHISISNTQFGGEI